MPTLEERSLDLVCWYESRPTVPRAPTSDNGTWHKDAGIARELHWWKGGKQYPQGNPTTKSQQLKQADAALVRRARRYVDRNNNLFSGYSFGTKRNGSGPRWSHLSTPTSDSSETATDAAAAEQFARLSQMEQQHGVELERDIDKIEALQETYTAAVEIDKAICLHDAVVDIRATGRISPATVSEARRLGIPIPVGRWIE